MILILAGGGHQRIRAWGNQRITRRRGEPWRDRITLREGSSAALWEMLSPRGRKVLRGTVDPSWAGRSRAGRRRVLRRTRNGRGPARRAGGPGRRWSNARRARGDRGKARGK